LSFCQAPIWGLRTHFYYRLLIWGAFSNERTGLPFAIAAGSSPAQSFLDPSPAKLVTILYCLRFETRPTWRARSP
jgi:hypothetical protein